MYYGIQYSVADKKSGEVRSFRTKRERDTWIKRVGPETGERRVLDSSDKRVTRMKRAKAK